MEVRRSYSLHIGRKDINIFSKKGFLRGGGTLLTRGAQKNLPHPRVKAIGISCLSRHIHGYCVTLYIVCVLYVKLYKR